MSDSFKVCGCGHFWHEHPVRFPSFWGEPCGECDCKRYRKHADMTYEAAMEYRRSKCSPSQQPRSGTSPSPSPSPFQIQLRIPSALNQSSPSPSPSESPREFPPETRSMPVVGFRAWLPTTNFKLGVGSQSRLSAMNAVFGEWSPGINVAKCQQINFQTMAYPLPPLTHSAPQPQCTCGFYVLTDLDKVPWQGVAGVVGVVGAVVGWGRVVQHDDEGWRAEKVQVIALLDTKWSDEHLQLTQRIAARYGVPVLNRTALELLAKEYGERLS